MKIKKILVNIYLILFVAVIIVTMLTPFVYLVSASFKSDSAFIQEPLKIIPSEPVIDNYIKLFDQIPFYRQFLNSSMVSIISTLLAVFFACFVAYGFSRYEFKGKKILFSLMLATLFIPPQALTVPHFMLFRDFGWINTYLPLILPTMLSAFYIYLMVQQMKGVPRELVESATIDGCNDLQVMFNIYIPLVKSGIGIVSVLRFMASWNDYMTPLIYINSSEMQTLPVGLTSLKSHLSTAYGSTMAGSLLASIPVIVLLLVVGKKYFVSGVMTGGVKG